MSGWLIPFEVEALLLSLKVAFWATLISLPFGIGAAWLLARHNFPLKGLLDGVIHLPLVLPPVVVGYMLLISLGRNGPVGGWLFETFGITVIFTWQGAAIASGVIAFPLLVRAIRLSMEAIDPRLDQVAQTLGAGRVRRFVAIALPLSLPGILAGTVLAFARALGEFGATITFVSNIPGETRTLPLGIYTAINTPGAEDAAFRLVVIAALLAFAALGLSEMLARRVDRFVKGQST
ncbi:MAG: molybdate ABC transporter permease subunit [Alphaproteobacteria bacterium]|nr:molybdate ABC transporter permease subunit [Alphaproteobacteria bacterium]